MTVSFNTFDRLKTKGVAAYKNGDYLTARAYLTDAAECLIALAEAAKTPKARRQHEELAAELIDLAKDCDRLHRTGRRGKPVRGNRTTRGRTPQREQEDDGGPDASEWIIREKPAIGFDDIAGLELVSNVLFPLLCEDVRLAAGVREAKMLP